MSLDLFTAQKAAVSFSEPRMAVELGVDEMRFQLIHLDKDEARGDYLYFERCALCDNHDMNNEVIQCLANIKQAKPFTAGE